MTNATAKSFLLTILQRDAADADPTADARTVAALVEREAATVRALREAEGLRHLVLVSVGDERLREVSRMPLWGEEAARAAEAERDRMELYLDHGWGWGPGWGPGWGLGWGWHFAP